MADIWDTIADIWAENIDMRKATWAEFKTSLPRTGLGQLAARSPDPDPDLAKGPVFDVLVAPVGTESFVLQRDAATRHLRHECVTCGVGHADLLAGRSRHLYGICRDAGQIPRPVEQEGPVSKLADVPGTGLREPFIVMCDDQSEPP